MKISKNYIAAFAVAASMSLVACNDLDTEPQGNHVTSNQKGEAVALQPGLAAAGVVGISSTINQSMAVYSSAHCDFGWPGVMMFLDCIGPDLVSDNIGYNWFSSSGEYNYGNDNNYIDNLSWRYGYKWISAANTVLANIDPETTDPQLQLYAAQGYANRAAAYFNLIQLYQNTYKGNESKPGLPLLTNENLDQVALDGGCERATVQETYDLIMSDLNTAVSMLESSGLGTDKIAEAGVKRFFSLGAAYGLRARVNLVMNNWQAAASDARQAIQKSGATPLSIAEASQPGFNTSDAHNWMWAVYVQEIDRVVTTGICNFPSHMGSLSYGYAQVGSWRRVSKALYVEIPDTDCRKGWFLDENKESKNLNANQQAYIKQYGAPAYTQVKFAPYQNVLGTSTNASDIPLMRVEEMYLIEAEATGMGGDLNGGKQLLENFVKTYRDPGFKSQSTTAGDFQDEVWNQRRIELFGEGMAYYDLMRLNKGLDRRGAGFPAEWVYNVPGPLKPFVIPQGEAQSNALLGSQNDSWSKPDFVDDL